MVTNIEGDVDRFNKIIKNRIRKNLGDVIKQGKIESRVGGKKVSIPIYDLDIPKFRYGKDNQSGSGEGDGKVGDTITEGDDGEKEAQGKAGKDPGEHEFEVEVSLDELADILGEELELPKIEPKGIKTIQTTKDKYKNLRRVGPLGMMNFRHSYLNALKRQIMTGQYDPKKPRVVLTRDDMRFRSWTTIEMPETNALIIYLMDVSGSMGDMQKDIARQISFWIDLWLNKNYDGLESAYVIHDAEAREVDKETFYHTRESGGTMISSGYKKVADIIEQRYNPEEWNIYLFQYSDGDNWDSKDTNHCFNILGTEILPKINLMCYGQIESPWGSGQFYKDLLDFRDANEKIFGDKILTAEIADMDEILPAIKAFLGTGK